MQKKLIDEVVTSTKAAKLLGVTNGALRYWESKGELVPQRTNGKHRRYRIRDVLEFHKRRTQLNSITLQELGGNV